MGILGGVKWQTSRAAYNGPKQQRIVSKGTLYLIPAAASITMSRNQRVNLLFIICRFQSLNKKQIHGLLTRSQVGTCHPSRHMSPGTWHLAPGTLQLTPESHLVWRGWPQNPCTASQNRTTHRTGHQTALKGSLFSQSRCHGKPQV